MNEDIQQIVGENIESTLFQTNYAHYQNFQDMHKFLENSEACLEHKIDKINDRMEVVEEEFLRTSTVLQMNNKKRLREEELLRLERDRVHKDLEVHQDRLSSFSISPITPILRQKQKELEKLEQSKEIIEEFKKLIKGSEQEMKNIMPLDSKNFSTSALKIYVFKVLLDDIHGHEYDTARVEINKKYEELKSKIIQNFKEGFRNKDTKTIRATLPYCEEYELMDQVSEFYNQQIFKSVNKITEIMPSESRLPEEAIGMGMGMGMEEDLSQGISEIKNMFFLVEQGFQQAFNYKDQTTREMNPYQINNIMGAYSESLGRKLVTHAFDKIILESLEGVLKSCVNCKSENVIGRRKTSTSVYLGYLEIFYDECRNLIKKAETLITDERVIHLMSTYFESIFDAYLDSYVKKELNNLSETYEICTYDIMKEIEEVAVSGTTEYAKEKEKVIGGKKTFKQLLNDFTIESRKNVETESLNRKKQIIGSIESNKKIKNLLKVFMNPSLENLFIVTKKSLARNNKIAKINEMYFVMQDRDKNRNEILEVFISNMEEIIQNLISLVSEIVPPFDERAPSLDPEFFLIIPNINILLQRIEFMYEEYKRENQYRLTESIKLDQKKESLIQSCGKSLNKVVAEAMATILAVEHKILSQDDSQYFIDNDSLLSTQPGDTTEKVLTFLDRYYRVICKINYVSYRNNIMKTLGLQFVSELIEYYSNIAYNKDGMSKIFMDIAKYKTIVTNFCSSDVEEKFKLLRTLIDIYVIKNDDQTIEDYIRAENLLMLVEREAIIQNYIRNKKRCEKA